MCCHDIFTSRYRENVSRHVCRKISKITPPGRRKPPPITPAKNPSQIQGPDFLSLFCVDSILSQARDEIWLEIGSWAPAGNQVLLLFGPEKRRAEPLIGAF